jgi:hypothetical protein
MWWYVGAPSWFDAVAGESADAASSMIPEQCGDERDQSAIE